MRSQIRLIDKLCRNLKPGTLEYIGLCAKILSRGDIQVGDSIEKIDQGLSER